MDKNDVREAWNNVSERYAQSRNPDGPDADLITELLQRLPESPLILDVGCGDGARTLANLPKSAVGLDISRRGLSLAQGNGFTRLVEGDMSTLPIATDSMDGITAYHAVFHVPRDEHGSVFEEFARVLRSDGVLLMTLPTGSYETVRRGWMGGRMFFSSPGGEKTLSLLRDAGFTDLDTVTTDDPLGSTTQFVFARRG